MTKKLSKKPENLDYDEELDPSLESEEDLVGVSPASLSSAVAWGTDWTAATIVDQLRRGTIALDPAFQRRDAWSNDRKSLFIESLILGLPIPQLVLAENAKAKGKFIVIDGKQRLLSLSRFSGVGLAPDQTPLELSGLKIREDLNNLSFAEIKAKAKYEDLVSEFENQPIRTVVIRGWKTEEVLYTIFPSLEYWQLTAIYTRTPPSTSSRSFSKFCGKILRAKHAIAVASWAHETRFQNA